MRIVETISEMQSLADVARSRGHRVGLVPTMGFLHEGHLSLVRLAKQKAGFIVVSIFVNPTQFGPGEDYQEYPRDFNRDCQLLEGLGIDVVFAPSASEMYPPGYLTYVEVEEITRKLCGISRPTHFRGVTTVVTKLFCAVKPHLAVFGQKDAQQVIVIKRMVRDLNFDIDIVVAPTVREPDGLAMSSRNLYLSEQERKDATVLYESLQRAKALIETGERDARRIIDLVEQMISHKKTARIDYVAVVDTERLEPMDRLSGEVLIALAVRFGRARLIDNVVVEV
ncbi:MAG TPA: pantoate--beta-alanine ligase [Candidatus Latescibacteria bacterium]|nr:pantoate--beta-alanine ligase [Candidatus Latescibacterota bacterium]